MKVMSPVPVPRDNPEKNNPEEYEVDNVEIPQFVIDQNNSDSDEENEPHLMGYQPLSQEPMTLNDSDEDDDDDENGDQNESDEQHSNFDQVIMQHLDQDDLASGVSTQELVTASSEAADRHTLWNHPRGTPQTSPMDQEHADKVRAAMSGFSLPLSHQPDWAKVIPEDEWKAKLLAKTDTQTKSEPGGAT